MFEHLNAEEKFRAKLFLVGSLLAFCGHSPLTSLSSTDASIISNFTYFGMIIYTIYIIYFVIKNEPQAFKAHAHPFIIIMMIWIFINSCLSYDMSLSIKRYFMLVFFTLPVTLLFLLPKNKTDYGFFLGSLALFILGVSYVGFLLYPSLTIHQSYDVGNGDFDGLWRGIWIHKNESGPMCVAFILLGIFVYRLKYKKMGIVIGILSFNFLLHTGAKTSTGIFILTAFLSYFALKFKNFFVRSFLLILPSAAFHLLALGPQFSTAIKNFSDSNLSDPTWSGRDDIWKFALEFIEKNPFQGFGYSVFWESPLVKNGQEDVTVWAGISYQTHNSFLELWLELGIVGLILSILMIIVMPLLDISKALKKGADPDLLLFFTQIWSFFIALVTMEAYLFRRFEVPWSTIIIAIFGLRYLALFTINGDER